MPAVPPCRRLSLGEGDTPALEAPRIAAAVGLERLVLKREDLNPTGSHKDRAAAFQVSVLAAREPPPPALVVSSSGNAGLATAAYGRLAGVPVAVFLSRSTEAGKTAAVLRAGGIVVAGTRPIALADEVAAALGAPNLRPSVDPLAPEAYRTLAWELVESIEPVDALFTFVSSGASLVGIGRGLDRAPWRPSLHAVQGTGAHPVAGPDDPRPDGDAPGAVGALGARKTRRVGECRRLMASTGGRGWVVGDDEAREAASLLATHGVVTSLEGAASLAAAWRAARAGALRSAVVVLTGARREATVEEAAVRGAMLVTDDPGEAARFVLGAAARTQPGATDAGRTGAT